MRRFDESQEAKFQRYVKIGEDNAECLHEMRRWCKHVELEQVTEGLYAQMTGLPIASHSIGCGQVEGKSQSMNLRWIVSDFLAKHCSGCQRHAPNGDVSWGQTIIDKHREEIQRREQAARERAARTSTLRSALRSQSQRITADADVESRRILEFLEAVFSESEPDSKEASTRLRQSACLGADLFPDAAVELLLELATSDEFAEAILPICAELGCRRSDLSARLRQMALGNIAKGRFSELSAMVVEVLGEAIAYPLCDVHIEKLIQSQDHHRPIGQWEDRQPDYSHSTTLLVRSFDADPDSVQTVLRRSLGNDSDYIRLNACGALTLLQQARQSH